MEFTHKDVQYTSQFIKKDEALIIIQAQVEQRLLQDPCFDHPFSTPHQDIKKQLRQAIGWVYI